LRVLEDSCAQVSVPKLAGYGRPMFSRGLLDKAEVNARANMAILSLFVAAGAFVMGCEPSCILTLRHDYRDG
jgi:Fe-S oxidoreductase